MRSISALILAFLALVCAVPANAAETSPIKCGPNEERVWVYDSLSSFDVALKLKCGEQVEIISREKGYVKIRTSEGKEGYVPEKALPKPPGAEGNDRNPGEAQTSSQQEPQTVAAAARTRTSVSSAPGSVTKPPEHALTNVSQTKPVAAPPASAPGSAETTVSTVRSSTGSAKTGDTSATPRDASNREKPKVEPAPTHSQAKPAAPPVIRSTTQQTNAANADPQTSASPSKTRSAPNAEAANAKHSVAKPNSSKDISASNTAVAGPEPVLATHTNIELADNVPSAPPGLTGSTHVAAAAPRDPDEEEEPVMKSVESSEACRIYFSAYGLSPNQYKWMTRNRGKNFSGICPAPGPDKVDFVVIFTHDVDFYNGTMPTLVHTDKNGFSDFTPLTTVDSAVVSASDADKSRREYVWVFHTKRGTFDPAKFSPKRRPLFSTAESNKLGTAAGSRSAEDALRFIEQHGVDR